MCYSLCLMLSQYCWYVHLCKRLLRSVFYHFTYNSVMISQVRLKFQPKVPFLLREDPINLNPVTLHSFIHSFTSFYILYLQCCHSRSGEDSTMSQPSTSDRLVCFNCNIQRKGKLPLPFILLPLPSPPPPTISPSRTCEVQIVKCNKICFEFSQSALSYVCIYFQQILEERRQRFGLLSK